MSRSIIDDLKAERAEVLRLKAELASKSNASAPIADSQLHVLAHVNTPTQAELSAMANRGTAATAAPATGTAPTGKPAVSAGCAAARARRDALCAEYDRIEGCSTLHTGKLKAAFREKHGLEMDL